MVKILTNRRILKGHLLVLVGLLEFVPVLYATWNIPWFVEGVMRPMSSQQTSLQLPLRLLVTFLGPILLLTGGMLCVSAFCNGIKIYACEWRDRRNPLWGELRDHLWQRKELEGVEGDQAVAARLELDCLIEEVRALPARLRAEKGKCRENCRAKETALSRFHGDTLVSLMKVADTSAITKGKLDEYVKIGSVTE